MATKRKAPAKKAPPARAPAKSISADEKESLLSQKLEEAKLAQKAVAKALTKYASQSEAAEVTGVAKSYLSRIMQDETREIPGPLTLKRLGITRRVVYTVNAA